MSRQNIITARSIFAKSSLTREQVILLGCDAVQCALVIFSDTQNTFAPSRTSHSTEAANSINSDMAVCFTSSAMKDINSKEMPNSHVVSMVVGHRSRHSANPFETGSP